MMKTLLHIGMAAALAVVAAGCSKSDDSGELTVGQDAYVWNADVREQTIKVEAEGRWTAESDVYWCAPMKESGSGNAELPVWVSPNLTSTARRGTITIKNKAYTRTVSVEQPAFTGSIDDYVYHLPVVFHVLYDDASNDTLNVKEGHLAKVLKEVNQLYADNGMRIEFEMARYDDDGEPLDEAGVERHKVGFDSYSPQEFLSASNEDNNQYAQFAYNLKKYINVYVYRFKQADASKVTMGIATTAITTTAHPLDSLIATDAANDYAYTTSPWGVCINNAYIYEWQDENTINPRYIVSTLAHELGHYLGLLHTFSAVECDMDDACDDTPVSDYENYSQWVTQYIADQRRQGATLTMKDVARRTDCKTGEEFLAHNVMDYAYCYNDELSAQQRLRTRHVLYYGPLVPGPKLVLYNTTGRVTRGSSRGVKLDVPVVSCPGI